MKQKTKQIILGTATIAAVFVLSGCGGNNLTGEDIMNKAIESQTGGKVNVNADNETMNVETKDGSFSAGQNVKIPDNFPQDIFIFSDAKIVFAMSGISGEKSFSISYLTSAVLEESFAKYKDEMAKNGWQKETEMDLGAQGKILNFKKGQMSVAVTMGISEDEETKGKTQIGLTVVEDASANSSSSVLGGAGGETQE